MLGERQSVTAEDLEKMVYMEQVVLYRLSMFVPSPTAACVRTQNCSTLASVL